MSKSLKLIHGVKLPNNRHLPTRMREEEIAEESIFSFVICTVSNSNSNQHSSFSSLSGNSFTTQFSLQFD